jgi:hypothetical protein
MYVSEYTYLPSIVIFLFSYATQNRPFDYKTSYANDLGNLHATK